MQSGTQCSGFTSADTQTCSMCSQCGPYQYAAAACTDTTDTVCDWCPPGCSECSSATQCSQCDWPYLLVGDTCRSCTDSCEPGSYVSRYCDYVSHPTECSLCGAGSYSPYGGECFPCVAGTYATGPGAHQCL